MCGVLGFVAQEGGIRDIGKFRELITGLFIETQSRGAHASGFAALVKGNKISYSKMPVNAALFCDHDHYYRSLWEKKPSIFIGHCRYSTAGQPQDNRNNHPFWAADNSLWMVHNGICPGLESKVNKKMLVSKCDSEYILRLIEEKGWDDGLKVVLNTYGVDFACLWMDARKKEMRFMRDSGRPLVMYDAPKFNACVFASTPELFEAAVKGAGLDMADFKMKVVEEYKLYRLDDKGEMETVKKYKAVHTKMPKLIGKKDSWKDILSFKEGDMDYLGEGYFVGNDGFVEKRKLLNARFDD